MSEATKQRSYRTLDVLIEGARVLSSSYPDIGVMLTGQELEILRNLMNYTQMRGMFVGEYHTGYYLSVDDDDWLAIETIVGILERKLMGTDNVIFGYNDQLAEAQDDNAPGAGSYAQDHDNVPSGELWVVTGASFLSSSATGSMAMFHLGPSPALGLMHVPTWTANKYTKIEIPTVYLAAGDYIRFQWYGLLSGQRVLSQIWGYKMKVEA